MGRRTEMNDDIGVTASELVEEFGLDATVAVADLIECGLVVDSGRRRLNPSTGEREVVWLVSEAGRRAISR